MGVGFETLIGHGGLPIECEQDFGALAILDDAHWHVNDIGATADFDPGKPNKGQTILLSGVRNRCGWEWSGREYGFAMKYQGVVIGGIWESHVLRALEHAWYELKLDVNDRIPWDVIAVVEGPSTIGERTQRVIRDAGSGAELGTIEEWPPVDCLLLQVVGLHAGPVAIGPQVGG